MKKSDLYALVLVGGSGTRLWPVSREFFPKQFTTIAGSESLFQSTVRRLLNFISEENIFFVAGNLHIFLVEAQLKEIGLDMRGNIISEPSGRNTAAAILLGTLNILKVNNHANIIVFPSDHIIENNEQFMSSIESGYLNAEKGYISTLGIKPSYPETGYGYIEIGDNIEGDSYKVSRFVEKPGLDDAAKYVESGNYFWNSGMFLFNGNMLIDQFRKYAVDIYNTLNKAFDTNNELSESEYNQIPNISFDYAIMEKTNMAAVVVSEFDWSDVGSWKSVHGFLKKDSSDNVLEGDVVVNNSTKCLIKGENRLIVANGLQNIAIVDTEDALLVSNIDDTEQIKNIVSDLKNSNKKEALYSKRTIKPWGYYTDLFESEGYRVKEIVVRPGSRLSLQKHKFRSEHWVVTKGIAKVTNGENVVVLNENESIFIPMESMHRLENESSSDLHIIEVQFGTYLGEDDIVRIEDDFGRADK